LEWLVIPPRDTWARGLIDLRNTLAGEQELPRTLAVHRKKPSFQSIDGSRCVSILAVVWHHSLLFPSNCQLLNLGLLGVGLFFVISGFLVVTLNRPGIPGGSII
jgi:hypothetical protein